MKNDLSPVEVVTIAEHCKKFISDVTRDTACEELHSLEQRLKTDESSLHYSACLVSSLVYVDREIKELGVDGITALPYLTELQNVLNEFLERHEVESWKHPIMKLNVLIETTEESLTDK